MGAVDIATLLRDLGGYGLAGLFFWLFLREKSDNTTLHAARLADIKGLTDQPNIAAEAMRAATLESTRQGESNTRAMEANTRAMEAVLRQTGNRQ